GRGAAKARKSLPEESCPRFVGRAPRVREDGRAVVRAVTTVPFGRLCRQHAAFVDEHAADRRYSQPRLLKCTSFPSAAATTETMTRTNSSRSSYGMKVQFCPKK